MIGIFVKPDNGVEFLLDVSSTLPRAKERFIEWYSWSGYGNVTVSYLEVVVEKKDA
jgi:hypothetical protein